MRKLNISPPRLVFMAGVALLCACHKSENEQIFDKLDRVIAKKHLYEERFVRHADSLRRELRAAGDDTLRWQTANRLFDSYITYNIDTAARYAGLMHNYADATGSREMKFLSTTCDVSVLIARNNIEEAYERILSLDTVGITRRMRASYYTQQMVVFGGSPRATGRRRGGRPMPIRFSGPATHGSVSTATPVSRGSGCMPSN